MFNMTKKKEQKKKNKNGCMIFVKFIFFLSFFSIKNQTIIHIDLCVVFPPPPSPCLLCSVSIFCKKLHDYFRTTVTMYVDIH